MRTVALLLTLLTLSSFNFLTKHDGAFHTIADASWYEVMLTDGSCWNVSHAIPASWHPGDSIIITANKNWFSPYTYRLVNQTLSDSVSANLRYPGDPRTGLARIVIGFHIYLNYIYLDDGTVFEMAPDESLFRWNIGDVILIGSSNCYDYRRYHNLLINTTNNRHVRCQRVQ